MRFHCGFSFRPKFNKWLIIGLLGLLTLLLNSLNVFADSLTYQPYNYYQDSNTEQWYYPTLSGDSTSYWYTIAQSPSQFYGDHFTQLYQLGTLNLCSSGFANITLSYNLYDVDSQLVSNSDIYTYAKYYNSTDIIQFESLASSYTQSIKLTNVDLSRAFTTTMVMNDFPYHSIQPGLFAGFKTFTYDCIQKDSALIMNNATQNTQNIINNQNENTQTIINNQNENTEEITDSINDLNDNLMEPYDGSSGGHDFDLPTFIYPSTIQGMFNLPIDLLRTIVNNQDSCTPYNINFSSLTQRWGGFNYTLQLPCLGTKLQSLLGVIYTLVDSLIAFYLFYNLAMYVLQIIDAITSGTDLFSYLYHGSNNNGNTGYGHYNRDTGEVVD